MERNAKKIMVMLRWSSITLDDGFMYVCTYANSWSGDVQKQNADLHDKDSNLTILPHLV